MVKAATHQVTGGVDLAAGEGRIHAIVVKHIANPANAFVAGIKLSGKRAVREGITEVCGTRALTIAVVSTSGHTGVGGHDRAAVVIDDLGVANHGLVGVVVFGATADVGDT
jgi:hypothetical protein